MNNVMELWKYPLLVLISLSGSFVQRVTGFGYGIFVMMFLPALMGSSVEAAALAGLISCCTCTYNVIRMRGSVRWKLVLPTVAASLVTVPIAVRFSAVAPEALVRSLLGVALILLSIYFLFFAGKVRLRPSVPAGLAAGGLSGVLGGMFSMGGPPIVLYLVQAVADKTVYFATLQAHFAVTNLYTAATRAINGMITVRVLGWFAVAVAGSLLGNHVGGKLFDKLDSAKMKKLVYLGMIVSGITMIF